MKVLLQFALWSLSCTIVYAFEYEILALQCYNTNSHQVYSIAFFNDHIALCRYKNGIFYPLTNIDSTNLRFRDRKPYKSLEAHIIEISQSINEASAPLGKSGISFEIVAYYGKTKVYEKYFSYEKGMLPDSRLSHLIDVIKFLHEKS